MKRTKNLGLALVAVFAVSAMAATAASAAAPEFFHCVAKAGGTFAAGCETAGSGFAKEAVKTGSSIKFTDKEGVSHFNAKASIGFTCTEDTSKGNITGPKSIASATVLFTGCTAKEGTKAGCKANSSGQMAGSGIIETNTLNGTLGGASATKLGMQVPGESLVPTAPGTEFTKLEATCLGAQVQGVTGGVIGEVNPVGKMQKTGELIFACTSAGSTVQKLAFLDAGPETVLKAFSAPACFESKDEITFSENIEVT